MGVESIHRYKGALCCPARFVVDTVDSVLRFRVKILIQLTVKVGMMLGTRKMLRVPNGATAGTTLVNRWRDLGERVLYFLCRISMLHSCLHRPPPAFNVESGSEDGDEWGKF